MNIEEVKIRWKIAIDRGTIEALTHSLTLAAASAAIALLQCTQKVGKGNRHSGCRRQTGRLDVGDGEGILSQARQRQGGLPRQALRGDSVKIPLQAARLWLLSVLSPLLCP